MDTTTAPRSWHRIACAAVARGVGQFSLLTLCSASICHAGPKLHVTVWQDVMTKLIIRMALVKRGGTIYRPAGGSFLGSFLGRSTGRWYPLGVSGCTAGWQRSVPAPARGRWRHLGAGCYSRVFDCIVSGRVALLLRSAEIQPLFLRFAAMSSHDMLLMHTLCFCFSRLQGKLRATARGRMGPCYMLTLLHPLGLWMLPGGCWLWVLHVF